MTRTLPKLRGRSAAELIERSAQAFAAWRERAGARDASEPTRAAVEARLCPEASGGRATLDGWYEALVAGRVAPFFAGLDDRAATVGAIRALAPGAEAALLARARRMLHGQFDLLGLEDVRYPLPIDWHLDPVSGRRAPLRHWSRVPYLDPAVAGDHKVLWEINRHHVLVSLGQAYWHSGDEIFARTAAAWLDSWMDANPPKRGANWGSSLEIAFRAIAWLWTLRLLAGSSHLTSALFARAVGHLYLAGRHLERYLSTYFSPNTHLTGEALGLFYLGTQLTPLRDATRWRRRGERVLLEQLPIHIRPDGVYFEQSTWYQRYTVDFYLHFLILAERNGIALRERVGPTIERLLEPLMAIARPDGSMPLLGDDDGGRLLFLDGRPATDVRPPMATAAAMFNRGDFAFVAAAPSEELVWLLGPYGVDRFGAVRPSVPAVASRAFDDGGLYVMRDGYTSDANVMVVDCGPHGVYNGGHAHADALSFDLTVAGAPLFVDPGTYTYTTSREWRDHFRSTAAHNTATVNGMSSSEMAGPFSWERVAASRLAYWFATPAADYFEGSHDGFGHLHAAARHIRRVLFVKDGYWLVLDTIEADGEYELGLTFQAAPNITPRLDGDSAELFFDRRPVAVLRTFGGGHLSVEEGWVSPSYASRVVGSRFRYVQRALGNVTVASFIADASTGVRVERLASDVGFVFSVASRHGLDTTIVDGGQATGAAIGVDTDARVLWVRRDLRTNAAQQLFAVGCTRLAVDGRRLAVPDGAVSARLERAEWQVVPAGREAALSTWSAPHLSLI